MMFAYQLVRTIELHANQLASELLGKVQTDPELTEYQNVPAEELKERVYEIYRHLGNWLLGKDQRDIKLRYMVIGGRRAAQRVPLSQLIRALSLTKENLWQFLKRDSLIDRPVEIFGELELLQLLDQFFDRAIYYAATGYEEMSFPVEEKELVATART